MNSNTVRQMICESIVGNLVFRRIAGPDQHQLAASVADSIMADFGIEVAHATLDTLPESLGEDAQEKSKHEEAALKAEMARFIAKNSLSTVTTTRVQSKDPFARGKVTMCVPVFTKTPG